MGIFFFFEVGAERGGGVVEATVMLGCGSLTQGGQRKLDGPAFA